MMPFDLTAQSLIYAGQIMENEKQLQEYRVPKVRASCPAALTDASALCDRGCA